MLTDELIDYLFDGQPHLLAAPVAGWLASSRRFTAFVNDHHTKIRKKLRTVQDPERGRDLQLELETAYLLLQERSLNLEYEPQHPREGRSPDFAVSFTTSLTFMVEVTRLRVSPARTASDISLPGDRFSDMLCSKLGQLLPQLGNLLLVGVEVLTLTQADVQAAMLRLQQRAERDDPAIVQRYGFRDRADFFRHYLRLSGLLVRGPTPLQAGDPVILWTNPQAKIPLPAKVRSALIRRHTL
jgi:hypothetical protein